MRSFRRRSSNSRPQTSTVALFMHSEKIKNPSLYITCSLTDTDYTMASLLDGEIHRTLSGLGGDDLLIRLGCEVES
jgi:hypothetical protein